jgi:hypothetical protein
MSAHERERLSAYLDGELPPAERAEVEAHLATCPECAALLADLEGVDAVARELPVEAPSGYFDSLPGRVRLRIAGEDAPRAHAAAPRTGRRVPAWTWALAAALLLAVVTPTTMSRLMRARTPLSDAPEAPAPAAPTRSPATETLPERAVVAAGDDEVETARQKRREAGRGRLDQDYRAAEPEPTFAPPPPPPAALAPRPGLGAGKRDVPALSAPRVAENRPHELEKGVPAVAADLGEGAALEEAPPAGTAGRERAMADAVSSRASVVPPRVGGVSSPKSRPATTQAPAAPIAIAGAEPHAEPAAAEKKAVLSGDALAFAELSGDSPDDASGWRERREAWRAFIAEHPRSPRIDEAWTRMIEAGLEAWTAGGDIEDFSRARADATAYLQRDGASQKGRIRRLLEEAETR